MSKRQGINIPGIILDELKDQDYSNDSRFKNTNNKKRGSSKQLNRKDRRKQQRAEKKQKRNGKSHPQQQTEDSNEYQLDNKTHSKHSKHDKNNRKKESSKPKHHKNKEVELPFSSDDELSEGDFDEFDEGDLDEEEWEQLRELEGDDEDEDEEQDDMSSEGEESYSESEGEDGSMDEEEDAPMTAEETMAKLKKLKEAKNKKNNNKKEMTVEETMSALKSKKSSKKSTKKDNDDDEEVVYPMTPAERAAIEKDEMDMQYYAKKLKLKGKKKSIRARDEFDAIGGLLDGLDYFENYGEGDEEYGDFAIGSKESANISEGDYSSEEGSSSDDVDEQSEDEEESEEHVENPFSSDDELSEGDFDEFDEDDLDEEEWEQLRELEGGKSSKSKSTEKENPYIAPSNDNEPQEYIPPSLRKKQFEASTEESAVISEIQKKVKSSLNKLSDSNISVIITALNELYDSYPRNYVTEVITKQVLEIIAQKNKLLDGFIMNYAAVAFALFRLRGLETGASFIQTVVEVFLSHYSVQIKTVENIKSDEAINIPKECSNIITLLSYCYNFGFISCRLIYNLIRKFVETPNELTTELLLRIIAVSGQLIRGDDPSALKDILSELLANVKILKEQSPRLQFLLSTLSDLKNNRLKASIIAVDFHPLKKNISGIIKSAVSIEPLQVSLDDIVNVDTKGKWWLVGASWKGNMTSAFDGDNQSQKNDSKSKIEEAISLEDDLLDDIPDWERIAREQRMNTDVRRAIFVSVMSAQDYVDAFEKIEKLNLKNRQLLEIPKVLLHCLLADSSQNGYNPYYSLVVSKVCEQHHQLLKSFQFLFWDTVKKFENDTNSDSEDELSDQDEFDGDEDARLRKIANQGKFFGYLFSEGMLKLDAFKHVPIMGGLNSDGMLFVEVALYFMLLSLGKKSEKKKGKDSKGNRIFDYIDEHVNSIIVNGLSMENKATILKGLKWFIDNKLKYKKFLVGKPSEKSYIRDKRRIEWAVGRFTELINDEFEHIDV